MDAESFTLEQAEAAFEAARVAYNALDTTNTEADWNERAHAMRRAEAARDDLLYGTEDERRTDSYSGELIPMARHDDYVYVQDRDEWWPQSRCTYSDCMGQWLRDADTRSCEDSEDVMTSDWRSNNCYRAENGNWYMSSERCAEEDESYNEDREDSDGLLNYSANPLRLCKHPELSANPHALLFGVELEMEPINDDGNCQAIIDALGGDNMTERFILKEDGSLSEGGTELVTVPMSLDSHRAWNWAHILTDELRNVACSGSNTTNCGMHIHINRKALSPLTVGKMLVFINSQRRDLRNMLQMIAQRSETSWSKIESKKLTDGRQLSSDHYDALGLTSKGTCELRIFRGNLRPERVMKNIEFAHALVMYCRDSSPQTLESPGAFCAWLAKHAGQYPALVAFLLEKGYDPMRNALPRSAAKPAKRTTTTEEA